MVEGDVQGLSPAERRQLVTLLRKAFYGRRLRSTPVELRGGRLGVDVLADRTRLLRCRLRAHHEHRVRDRAGDEVLDIGCGTGLTTREAGRAAAPGRVVGVDLWERMLERARAHSDRAARERDVRVGRRPAVSLRPSASTSRSVASGRCSSPIRSPPSPTLRQHCASRDGWSCSCGSAASTMNGRWRSTLRSATPQPPPPTADPFSLGDARAATEMLARAGFEAVRFEDVHEPVLYGPDIDAALEFVCGFQNVSAALARMSRDDRPRRGPATRDPRAPLRRRPGRDLRFALLVDHRPPALTRRLGAFKWWDPIAPIRRSAPVRGWPVATRRCGARPRSGSPAQRRST